MISKELEKILKQAGVDPSLYDKDTTGIKKDFKPSDKTEPEKDELEPIDKEQEKYRLKMLGLKDEDYGGSGYSHNVQLPQDTSTMNKSTIGPIKEYKDSETRSVAIKSANTDRAIKLIFQWTRSGTIEYGEFEDLMAEIFIKVLEDV